MTPLPALLVLALVTAPGRPGAATALAPSPAPEPGPPRLAGSVRLVRTQPLRLKTLTNDVDVATCGAVVGGDALLVGRDGRLANVVVEARSPSGELLSPPRAGGSAPLELHLARCKVEPRILVVPIGGSVELVNEDGLLHEIVSLALKNLPARERMPRYRRRALLPSELFARAERVEVTCERHTWSRAWMVVTDNPHVAITAADGRFALEGLPAGPVVLTAWHEQLGTRTLEAEVPEAGEAVVDLTFE